MKEYWLLIKSPEYLGEPEIIEIEDDSLNHFSIKIGEGNNLIKGNVIRTTNLSNQKFEYLNPDRIRFHIKGKNVDVYGDGKAVTEEAIFEQDYERLSPTETDLTESTIQDLKFKFKWNNEEKILSFNTDLDSPTIQKVNLILNKTGRTILLEKLNKTLFLSFYSNNSHELLLPIKSADHIKLVLSGFPKEPYEVNCPIIK